MKAFKTYDCSPRAMTPPQTMAELLQSSLEVSHLTQDPSTYRGRRISIDLLDRALRRAGYLTIKELEATNLSVAYFIQALQEEVQENEQGKAYTTLSQQLSQICKILEEIGASLPTTTMLRNSKQRILRAIEPVRHQQETITQTQMMDVLLILEGLEDDAGFAVKGVKTTPRKKAMLRLYVMVSACYALRQQSILSLTREDFNEETFTYRLAKGQRHGEAFARAMHPTVWSAYCNYLEVVGEYPLFTDGSWLSAGVKVILTQAGVEASNGRHGLHRIRRAFATYCYHQGIPLEDAAAALNHADSSTTERVYQDVNAKQQRASLAMASFADHFLGIPQQLTEMEQQLESMTPWMSGVFTYGQPSFADDPLEPLYLDDDGNLSSLDNVVPAPMSEDVNGGESPPDRAWTIRTARIRVPAPRLELGTP
jgi:integrase